MKIKNKLMPFIFLCVVLALLAWLSVSTCKLSKAFKAAEGALERQNEVLTELEDALEEYGIYVSEEQIP